MSIRFNHPSNNVTSTDTLQLVVEGGTTSAPRPIRLSASSVIMPVRALPTGEAGAVVFDSASKTMKYHNGFGWVELLSAADILAPINTQITNIINTLGSKVDTVTYTSSSVASASISGTSLNIVFPSTSGGGGTDVPGLFTSSPPGSIQQYSLSSGQSVASIREQLSGVSGGQNGRDGSAGNPFVTKTGWCFADGLYWSWAGSTGTILRQVPNLNQNAYLKSITTSGVTKTDSVIGSSGSIGSTTITFPDHYHGTGRMSGLSGSSADDAYFIFGRTWGQTSSGVGVFGEKNSRLTATIDGSNSSLALSTTDPIYSSGNTNTHSHDLLNVDVSHFNVAVIYNIAEPSTALNQTVADARYVLKTGDVMTGSLTMAGSAIIRADDANLPLFFRNSSNGERAAIYHQSSTNTLRLRSSGGTELSLSNTGLLTAPTLTVTGNAIVQGKNVVRSVNGIAADTSGNVVVPVTSTSSSLGTNGWWKDNSSGLIRQWGIQTTIGNGDFVVTFPIPFTTVYNVSSTRIGTTASPTVSVTGISATGFTIRQADGGDGGTYWEAIGI